MPYLQVGDYYQEGRDEYIEGFQFNVFGQECLIEMFYENPHISEINAITYGQFIFGVLEYKKVLMVLFDFTLKGKSIFTDGATASYNIWNIPNWQEFDFSTPPNVLKVVLINNMTGKIAAFRQQELPFETKNHIYKTVQNQIQNPLSPQQAYNITTEFEQRFPSSKKLLINNF